MAAQGLRGKSFLLAIREWGRCLDRGQRCLAISGDVAMGWPGVSTNAAIVLDPAHNPQINDVTFQHRQVDEKKRMARPDNAW